MNTDELNAGLLDNNLPKVMEILKMDLEQKRRIKALMTIRGLSQLEFARKYDFQPSEVSRVISGKRHNRVIQVAIAQELQIQVEELFAAAKNP